MEPEPSSELISLRAAYDQLAGNWPGGNAYEWYRRSAQRSGYIWLGDGRQLVRSGPITVPVRKVGRQWMVAVADFGAALIERRAVSKELQQVTADYDAHRLEVSTGQISTSWGGYRVSGHFHFVWNYMAVHRRSSSGVWVCNVCWKSATTVHDKAECHTCRDWGSCGSDCTLSGIRCDPCGTSRKF